MRISLFIVCLTLALSVYAQNPPFVVYKSYTPPTNTQKKTIDPFADPFYNPFRNNNIIIDKGNEIVKRDRVSTVALCVENGKIYPIQLMLSLKRNGQYTFKCIGIKKTKDEWTSCDITVYDLNKLFENSKNKSQILKYMEKAHFLMEYEGYTYLIGLMNN